MKKEGIHNLTNAEYHREEALGSSDLKTLKTSFGHWKKKENKRTPALNFGGASHSIILENDESNIIKIKGSSQTNEFKNMVINFPEKDVVSNDEYELIQKMQEVFNGHELAKNLIKNGKAEQAIFWNDKIYQGINGKCKPDFLIEDKKEKLFLVVDYKTSGSLVHPAEFSRNAIKFGYDQSAAWYLRGVEQVKPTGHDYPPGSVKDNSYFDGVEVIKECSISRKWVFVIIAQEKVTPFAIQVYFCSDDFIELGHRKNEIALFNYRAGQIDPVNGYPEESLTLPPPTWALKEYDILFF